MCKLIFSAHTQNSFGRFLNIVENRNILHKISAGLEFDAHMHCPALTLECSVIFFMVLICRCPFVMQCVVLLDDKMKIGIFEHSFARNE